ncbi:hypothetical protein MESS2_930003 [Mesorhizobium metallidurans STM 2683]|uniref:Uncharacterized protein n=1 Tax=Mesorhizobium metallidurans STM 2683 TaxID=1297569 RepID=M5EZ48_9HYPH|nr:hypothetical protein MESS2_930003 [Mesorhizobium metallidurans STM 2683]
MAVTFRVEAGPRGSTQRKEADFSRYLRRELRNVSLRKDEQPNGAKPRQNGSVKPSDLAVPENYQHTYPQVMSTTNGHIARPRDAIEDEICRALGGLLTASRIDPRAKLALS